MFAEWTSRYLVWIRKPLTWEWLFNAQWPWDKNSLFSRSTLSLLYVYVHICSMYVCTYIYNMYVHIYIVCMYIYIVCMYVYTVCSWGILCYSWLCTWHTLVRLARTDLSTDHETQADCASLIPRHLNWFSTYLHVVHTYVQRLIDVHGC